MPDWEGNVYSVHAFIYSVTLHQQQRATHPPYYIRRVLQPERVASCMPAWEGSIYSVTRCMPAWEGSIYSVHALIHSVTLYQQQRAPFLYTLLVLDLSLC